MRDTAVLIDTLRAPGRAGVLQDAAIALAGSLVIAACAHLRVPMWPVPMTMQTFAVLLIGLACGPRLACATVALYLAQGLAGLPVFSGPTSLAGPTGGYLAGFLPAAMLVGALARRGWSRPPLQVLMAMAAGSAVIYACGALWLATFVGAQKALTLGVLPFLLGDGLKAALAATLVPALWQVAPRR